MPLPLLGASGVGLSKFTAQHVFGLYVTGASPSALAFPPYPLTPRAAAGLSAVTLASLNSLCAPVSGRWTSPPAILLCSAPGADAVSCPWHCREPKPWLLLTDSAEV
jgi:hypothetical protein